MTSPETQESPEKKRNLLIELMGLMREGILEGVIDPSKGTEFTIIQSEASDPFTSVEQITETGSVVGSVGIPNPLEYDFEEIVLDDEQRAAKLQASIEKYIDQHNPPGEE